MFYGWPGRSPAGTSDLSMTGEPAISAPSRRRYAIVDMVRGVAILLMISYHFSWDLTYFRYAELDLFGDPVWQWYARFIAGMILFVMGFAQALARRRGLTSSAFWRRLIMIGAAAGVVSMSTYFVDTKTYIFFGILHHITVASVLMLAVVRLPEIGLLILGLACLAAPLFLTSPTLTADHWLWLGLAVEFPPSVDFVPLFPWFGIPVLGLLAGRFTFRNDAPAVFSYQPGNPAARLLHLAGRHSLLIYLIHQPILFGGMYLFWKLASG